MPDQCPWPPGTMTSHLLTTTTIPCQVPCLLRRRCKKQTHSEHWLWTSMTAMHAGWSRGPPLTAILSLVTITCGTAGVCPTGGQPLRPALLWMDMRSADQAAQVLATGDIALEVNSGGRGPVSAEWMIGKALWIQQNEPELFKVCSMGKAQRTTNCCRSLFPHRQL